MIYSVYSSLVSIHTRLRVARYYLLMRQGRSLVGSGGLRPHDLHLHGVARVVRECFLAVGHQCGLWVLVSPCCQCMGAKEEGGPSHPSCCCSSGVAARCPVDGRRHCGRQHTATCGGTSIWLGAGCATAYRLQLIIIRPDEKRRALETAPRCVHCLQLEVRDGLLDIAQPTRSISKSARHTSHPSNVRRLRRTDRRARAPHHTARRATGLPPRPPAPSRGSQNLQCG
ncbi:uncharacterized protein C8Q71DRAFT_192324 [Rhodofomes roseus]|uniref:Uncharacterized protein n=1 Tax=Rhodofomes roseus TaxID=34475 RepID=A0ABQ8K8A6_9APHY|nr:uncharacterized protein C8Q71DRAFT_192324 [Rhodofomes roseus]KAH9833159.1 hypothetical protein C8Q71DRAFT_192324 [Rhodofomes roseus]